MNDLEKECMLQHNTLTNQHTLTVPLDFVRMLGLEGSKESKLRVTLITGSGKIVVEKK